MFSARFRLGRRSAVVLGAVAVLLSTGGVAMAQQVPPPGVIPAPPAVPPVSLPPEAGPAGEMVSVPGTFACSIPGGAASVARFATALAGLTQVDVDAVSPWFAPLYSVCLAFPPPLTPTQCDVDRQLRANGYGPNGLPVTVYFPDPVGTAVVPVEVAEREVAARAGALPVSPTGTLSAQLACEKLQPVRPAVADDVPSPALPLPGAAPAVVGATPSTTPSAPATASSSTGGDAGTVAAGATSPRSDGASASVIGDVATSSALPPARAAAAVGENRLQKLLTILAGLALVVLVAGTVMAKRSAPAGP